MQMLRCLFVFGLLAGSAGGAMANDSVAEIGAGGLVLGRSDVVSIESETLYLSMDEVRVDYLFHNNSADDVETIVAFPMPDIAFSPYEGNSIPVEDDNFLGFTVEVNGMPVTPQLQQRAVSAGGVDITGLLSGAGVPIAPYDAYEIDMSGVAPADLAAIEAAGAVEMAVVPDTGTPSGMAYPRWTVQSAYWWTMTFPANAEVKVRHTYAPAVGGAAGVFFLMEGEGSALYSDYEDRYCIDAPFVKGAKRRLESANLETGPYYTESWLSYVLTTGANWAGPIKRFRLIVDKGSTDNLVSFCGTGVTKTGPTTFEMVRDDFWPERDLDVLFIVSSR
jgi:hypothetical protein